jgi:hypothetical protein
MLTFILLLEVKFDDEKALFSLSAKFGALEK